MRSEIRVVRYVGNPRGVLSIHVSHWALSGACAAEEASKPKIEEAPAVAYGWHANDSRRTPNEVTFVWANGAACRFVPIVVGNRTFWMSRYPVTVNEWREYKPGAFSELKKVEAILPLEYGLSHKLDDVSLDALGAYLTTKYKKSLPQGHVIRSATAEELAAAISKEATQRRCELTERDMKDCVSTTGAVRRAKFSKLLLGAGLGKVGQWSQYGFLLDGDFMVTGLAMPHASGICELDDSSRPHLVVGECRGCGIRRLHDRRGEHMDDR